MIGIVYILTAISIAAVLMIGRTSVHEVRSTSEVFRYQSGLLKVLFFCSFIPLVINLALVILGSPKPSDSEMLLQMCFAVLLTGGLLFWCSYLRKFCVEVASDSFKIRTMFKEKVVPFFDVGRMNLLEGGKGEHVLSVLGRDGKELIRFSESLEDFDVLTELFKKRAAHMKIPFFYRDCHNHWSQ